MHAIKINANNYNNYYYLNRHVEFTTELIIFELRILNLLWLNRKQ